MVHTSISIPTTLIEKIGTRPRGTTVFEAIADALEASIHKLHDLVEAEQSRGIRPGGLFAEMVDRSAKKELTGTLNFRTTEQNVRQLDQLVSTHKADSRSQLITAALRHHHPGQMPGE